MRVKKESSSSGGGRSPDSSVHMVLPISSCSSSTAWALHIHACLLGGLRKCIGVWVATTRIGLWLKLILMLLLVRHILREQALGLVLMHPCFIVDFNMIL